MKPAERAAELRHALDDASYRYYVLDDPQLSDAEYDVLYRELLDLEERNPELIIPNSPTRRVGATPSLQFAPFVHERPMLSLANAFSATELREFDERVTKLAGAAQRYVVEPKIDGLAIALHYTAGTFTRGGTRGDGNTGEDVTPNLRTIRDIPLTLRAAASNDGTFNALGIPENIEVRGEAYIPKSAFFALNKTREEAGKPLFANPRNAASGGIRQLDSRLTKERNLRFYAYAIGVFNGGEHGPAALRTQTGVLEALRKWGFPVNRDVAQCATIEDAIAYCERFEDRRDGLDYEIDGVVIKVDDIDVQDRLGAAGRDPRWAIAYKFRPREAHTRLLAIEVNVGRTGTLNPQAVLEPVNIGGVVIRNASLHNEGDIQRKDIRIGDVVIVRRAGDVIPEIVGPVLASREGDPPLYFLPRECPVCGLPADHPEGEAMSRCTNIACPAQRKERIRHFASRSAMDIEGLGDVLAEQLVDLGLVRDVVDIYELDDERLATVPRTGAKTIANLREAVERSKTRGLGRLLFGLGIRFVGAQNAQVLAGAFGDIRHLANATPEDLLACDGIGPQIAQSVNLFFAQQTNCDVVERLIQHGVDATAPLRPRKPAGPLAGKSFVLTGTLPTLTREEAAELITGAGGAVKSAVSSKIHYVVAGDEAGTKLTKAQSLGIPILDEAGLHELLANGPTEEHDETPA